jgi:hypothetical protein
LTPHVDLSQKREPRDWISEEDARKFLGLAASTLYSNAACGRSGFPRFKIIDGQRMYSEFELLEWRKQHPRRNKRYN